MLKKYVSSLLMITLLAGCASEVPEESVTIQKPSQPVSSAEATDETEEDTSKVADEAQELIDELGLGDTLDTALVEGAIKGLFFQGDDSLYSDACVYLANEAGNSDTVAVFATKNADEVKEYISKYLESTEANAEEYFGEEVEKIKNAVVESNGKRVVLVISSDASKAESAIKKILG